MSAADPQLVQLITREVLAVLQQRGVVEAAAGPGGNGNGAPQDKATPSALKQPLRADVRPPMGVCTGDYSKFPELSGRLYAMTARPAATPVSTPAASAGRRPEAASAVGAGSHVAHAASLMALTGIVTANQLQAAMKAASDGVAVLAHDARLSPLAADLARQFPQQVQRVSQQQASAPLSQAADQPWLAWIDGQCPVAQKVMQDRRQQLRLSSAGPRSSGLTQVVREISASLRGRRIAGAILFVRSAARVLCYANRCLAIRAVVGTCGEAVEEGINELGANVLVIEYPHVGPKAMNAMVDRMMQQPPRVPASVERDLADLHRCE